MCHSSGITFGAKNISREEIKGKRIIEVGSYDVNGSLRPIVKLLDPAEYIGVDIEKGPSVDIVCNAENIVEKFGKESFDVVISTELLEHVRNWRKVISNIKNICKPHGIMIITTRSFGFHYHAYPNDFWRYELEDMENIFSDCEILALEKDTMAPGIFMKAQKPHHFVEKDLSGYKLYSIVENNRVLDVDEKNLRNFQKKYRIKERVINFVFKMGRLIFSKNLKLPGSNTG